MSAGRCEVRWVGEHPAEWWVVDQGWRPGRDDLVRTRWQTPRQAIDAAYEHNRRSQRPGEPVERLWPDVVRWALVKSNGRLYRAARLLGVGQPVLVRWLQEHRQEAKTNGQPNVRERAEGARAAFRG